MAQTDERSATAMPFYLVAAASAFLVMRLLSIAVGLVSPPAQASAVAWHSGRNVRVFESCVKPPPVVLQSPENLEVLPPPSGNKLVVYQFYADWSDACKLMEAAALSNAQVKQTIEQHFLPVRIHDAAHGKNPPWVTALEKRYRVFALPTMVVVDEHGKQVASLIGNCSSLTTYRFLTRALNKRG